MQNRTFYTGCFNFRQAWKPGGCREAGAQEDSKQEDSLLVRPFLRAVHGGVGLLALCLLFMKMLYKMAPATNPKHLVFWYEISDSTKAEHSWTRNGGRFKGLGFVV